MGQLLLGLVLLVVVVALGIALAPVILPVFGFALAAFAVLLIGAVILRTLDIAVSYPVHWLRTAWHRMTHDRTNQ
jgi:hypothetical protein